MDRLLNHCRELSKKVETNDSAASELLKQCESLQQELKAMRQVRREAGRRRRGGRNEKERVIKTSQLTRCTPHFQITFCFSPSIAQQSRT